MGGEISIFGKNQALLGLCDLDERIISNGGEVEGIKTQKS